MTFVSTTLVGAARGTMIGQVAMARGFSLDEVFANDREMLRVIGKELDELGLDAAPLASAILDAVVMIYASDKVIEGLVPEFANLLWGLLGDPENGGTTPPEAYLDATRMLWVAFLGAVNPNFLNEIKNLANG